MAVISVTLGWAVVAMLYFATGIYYKTAHGDKISNWATLAFIAVGAAILLVVNSRVFPLSDFQLHLTELLIMTFLLIGWGAGTIAMHIQVGYVINLRIDDLESR